MGVKRMNLAAVAVLAAVWCAAVSAAEEQLPENLAAKVKELAPEGTVRRVQQRDRRGENYFRVDLTLPGDHNGRIEIKPDGTVQEVRLELGEDQLPAAVKKTLAELYPKATFDNADRNLNDGQMVIDVEYKQDGRTLTVTVTDEGKVIDREDEIALAELPGAAQATIAKDFPGSTLTRLRRVTQNGQDRFEVRLERRLTVHLPDPAGSTTTEREIPAADLPEATRAAAAAATGRDPAQLTVIQRTTSPVTVYEIQVNDQRDLMFNPEGVLLNPQALAPADGGAAAANAAAPIQGQAPANRGNNNNNGGPGGQNAQGNRFGGRNNWQGNRGPGGNNGNNGQGGPGGQGWQRDRGQGQGERQQERPAHGDNAPPGNQPNDGKNPAPPEEVF